MKLCVIIPALNEEQTIADVIRRVPRELPGISETVVLVIDDGSTDATAECAAAAGAEVFTLPENRGVGQAFQLGVEYAIRRKADLMVNMDGDGQFDAQDIPKLIAPLMNGTADVSTASRFIDKEYRPEMSWVKYHGNKFMSLLVSALTGRKYYDVSCGFRAYTRSALLRMNLFGSFTYTQESFIDLSFKDVHIEEIPIHVLGVRPVGRSRVAGNLFIYAFNTSKIIFRSFRDYRPMRVFGALGFTMLFLAACFLTFLLMHYSRTHSLYPHKWAGFASGFLAALGFLILLTGLLADMLARIRLNQERILYRLKKSWDQRPEEKPGSDAEGGRRHGREGYG